MKHLPLMAAFPKADVENVPVGIKLAVVAALGPLARHVNQCRKWLPGTEPR